jgi:hypothetical protein
MRGRPEDLALVVPVLPLLARLPRSVRWISLEEAEALARVRRAAPDLPLAAALTLAVAYTRRGGSDTTDLDLYVAMRPLSMPDEPEEERMNRLRRYRAITRQMGVEPVTLSGIHPGLAYSMNDGTSVMNEED